MEEKKAAPEKKRSEEWKAPSMQKNQFADEPFNTLRGQFEAIQDNMAALKSQFRDLMNTVKDWVKQNQAHLRQAVLVRKENEKISKSVDKLENQVHMLKQRCCILEKLGKGIDQVREGMDKIPGAARDLLIQYLDDGGVQVRCNYNMVQECMNKKVIPQLLEMQKQGEGLSAEAIDGIFRKCFNKVWDSKALEDIKTKLEAIKQTTKMLSENEHLLSDDLFSQIIQHTLQEVLGTNKLHNLIKCAVAKNLAKIFKQNMLKKNLSEAFRENSENDMWMMESTMNELV
jgi:archaellum component FlaC